MHRVAGFHPTHRPLGKRQLPIEPHGTGDLCVRSFLQPAACRRARLLRPNHHHRPAAMSTPASPPPPPPPLLLVASEMSPAAVETMPMDESTVPKPGFTSLCRSLHDLLEAGKYREVWNATNDILTRALKLIDPITADFLRDDDDESASTFLLFHEYLLYSITVPGWALILALQREYADTTAVSAPKLHPQIAAQVFNFFTGAQKISNSLCRTVLANAKGRTSLVERTWKIRSMLLEETRQAIETLYGVDTEMVARAARSPFGKEAAMEPWQVLEALVPGELKLRPKSSVGDLLNGWTGGNTGTE